MSGTIVRRAASISEFKYRRDTMIDTIYHYGIYDINPISRYYRQAAEFVASQLSEFHLL